MRPSVNSVKNERSDIFDLLKSDAPLNQLFDLPSPICEQRKEIFRAAYNDIGETGYEYFTWNRNHINIKLECNNKYGANHYSRYWLIYLFIAETLGIIYPEDCILEVTSGSSGIALSHACRLLSYDLKLFVPKNISQARLKAIQENESDKNRIEIIVCKGLLDKCIEEFRIERKRKDIPYFTPNHAEESSEIIIDVFKRIGLEYMEDFKLKEDKPLPDYAILALGNGSSARGVLQAFSNHSDFSKLTTIGYHPDIEQDLPKLVLGLRPPNVNFKHLKKIDKQLTTKVFTDNYDISDIINNPYENELLKRLGETTLFACSIAKKITETHRGKSIFIVAYDYLKMYE